MSWLNEVQWFYPGVPKWFQITVMIVIPLAIIINAWLISRKQNG